MTKKITSKKITIKTILKKTVKIITIAYIIALLFLLIKQKDMLYFPDYPKESSFYECNNFTKKEKKEYKNTRFFEKKMNKQ